MALQRCVTNNVGQLDLTTEVNCRESSLTLGATIVRQHTDITFYSSFTTEGKCPQKSAPEDPLPPENCFQRIKLPFRKFQLYLRPNMIELIIRPRNLEEFLTVRCC